MIDRPHQPLLFSGSSHHSLACEVANLAEIEMGKIAIDTFSDGEIAVKVDEGQVIGREAIVFQTIAREPNSALMELFIIVDALKRAEAANIVAVIPYFGYCRADRKDQPGVPISAKLVANLMAAAGINRLVTVDLHSSQMQGFFDLPVDNLQGYTLLLDLFREIKDNDTVVVAPNVGSIQVARTYAAELGAGFAVIDRRRGESNDNECKATLIGDVKGKKVLLADDICSTGATLASAAKACHEKGAKQIFGAVTHGLCVGNAVQRLQNSPLEKLWITNSIPPTELLRESDWVQPISIAPLIAKALRR